MKRFLFITAALVSVLVVAEVICRIAFPGLAKGALYMRFTNPHREQSGFYPDDELFWKLSPDNAAWEVNHDGFRGPPVPVAKPDGEVRIVCLGDSCTFGLGETGLAYAQTWPAVLQEIMTGKPAGRAVRALNFGCPGTTSFQGLRLLKSKASNYHPDIVIAYFGINDGFDAVGYADKDQRQIGTPGSLSSILVRSAFYKAMTRLIVSARRGLARGAPLERVSIEDYHRNLESIAGASRSIGATAYFIAPPYLDEQGGLRYEEQRVHVPSIDVMPALRAVVAEGRQAIFPAPDNVHPTAQGHAAIARAVADRLLADKVAAR